MKQIGSKTFFILVLFLTIGCLLLGITNRSLNGDEYGSITESFNLGRNFNGIGYFMFMHFWVMVSTDELWLRIPSLFFGILSVVFIFQTVKDTSVSSNALIAMLIAGTSPFLSSTSQQVRFYSFFIFATVFCLWTTVKMTRQASRKNIVLWISSCLLLPLSHFLGSLVLFVILIAFIAYKKRSIKSAIVGGAIITLVFVIPLIPGVLNLAWKIYSQIAAAYSATKIIITPITLVNFFKLLFSGYIYFFGYQVHPLSLLIVVPGILIIGMSLIFAMKQCYKNKENYIWQLLVSYFFVLFIGVYLVFDPIGGRLAGGVSPRHASFIWPVLMILIGLGFVPVSRISKILVVGLLLINLYGNFERIYSQWSYESNVNYKRIFQNISIQMSFGDWVVYDGRSIGPMEYYLQKNNVNKYLYNNIDQVDIIPQEFENLPKQILVLSNDYRPEIYNFTNQQISNISKAYSIKDLEVEYPFFAILFEKNTWSETGIRVVGGAVQLPFEIYSLEFQDLVLPFQKEVSGQTMNFQTSYRLEAGEEIEIPLDSSRQYQTLQIFTNTIPSQNMRMGDMAMQIIIKGDSEKEFPLLYGKDVMSWNATCRKTDNCVTTNQWHKRLALLGYYGYPDAWKDFLAGIHQNTLSISSNGRIKNITIQNVTQDTSIYLWGLILGD